MDAHVTSSPDERQRRARTRLIAWAGILAMVLQLAAPLMGAAAARILADDGAPAAFTAVICSSVAGTAHTPDGNGPVGPDTPSRDSLPCTLCLVCQAGSLGAKLVASASPHIVPERTALRVEPAQSVFASASSTGRRPPTRAPPPLV